MCGVCRPQVASCTSQNSADRTAKPSGVAAALLGSQGSCHVMIAIGAWSASGPESRHTSTQLGEAHMTVSTVAFGSSCQRETHLVPCQQGYQNSFVVASKQAAKGATHLGTCQQANQPPGGGQQARDIVLFAMIVAWAMLRHDADAE